MLQVGDSILYFISTDVIIIALSRIGPNVHAYIIVILLEELLRYCQRHATRKLLLVFVLYFIHLVDPCPH